MQHIPHPRFLLFLVLFAAGSAALLTLTALEWALILAFDGAAMVFILGCLPLWLESNAHTIRARAERDDAGRALMLVIMVITLVVVLAAIVRMLSTQGEPIVGNLLLVMATLVLAWVFINTVYALHYSHLYYDQNEGGDVGGVGFSGNAEPVFSDFCYLSFGVGMACQVSDQKVETAALRRAVTLHGLFAFFFNLGVLALVVNVLAGLI